MLISSLTQGFSKYFHRNWHKKDNCLVIFQLKFAVCSFYLKKVLFERIVVKKYSSTKIITHCCLSIERARREQMLVFTLLSCFPGVGQVCLCGLSGQVQ